MRYRLRHVAVHQTALVAAVLYGLIAVLFVPLVLVVQRLGADVEAMIPWFTALLIPVVYALGGYVFTAIGCWVYNRIAAWLGGVEFTLEERPDAEIPSSVRT